MPPGYIIIIALSVCSLLIVIIFKLRKKALKVQKNLEIQPIPEHSELIEMVRRYNFFAGSNLNTFETLLTDNNLQGIEQLIREKFEAQGKTNSEELATTITTKLLTVNYQP